MDTGCHKTGFILYHPVMSCDYDIVIVGGGITGLGVALAGVKKGHRILVLEKDDGFCRKTSANSLRIIHGGFRYLQTLNIARVIDSIRCQSFCLRAPADCVEDLPCIMPLKRFGLMSRFPVMAATFLFGCLQILFRGKVPFPRVVGGAYVDARIPVLKGRAPYGALLWHDGLLQDQETFADWIIGECEHLGATFLYQASLVAAQKDGEYYILSIKDRSGTREVTTNSVVNSSGPWMGAVEKLVTGETEEHVAHYPKSWCLGINVVLNRLLEEKYAFGVKSNEPKNEHGKKPLDRLFFLVPREGKTVLGTWYIPFEGDVDAPKVPDKVIEEFVASAATALPHVGLSVADVASIECGVLPMIRVKDGEPDLYGAARFEQHGHWVDVMSTKFTTFYTQGEKIVKMLGQVQR